jgi:CheY-like chemotaxis protein
LIELHGGTIEAASPGPGQGSEFVVRLPIDDVSARPAEEREPQAAAVPPQRILVADDNHDSAESLAILLRLAGHEVETASDGEQALAAAERFRPHVAVLDLGMPRLSGHDVARALRQKDWASDLVLVAATGWSQPEEFERTREAGFDAHLVKPVESRALLKLLSGDDLRKPRR